MNPVDIKDIHKNAHGSVHQDNADAQAGFIIANSDKHEGMVKTWRIQALNYRASYEMLQGMNERFLEIKAAAGDAA